MRNFTLRNISFFKLLFIVFLFFISTESRAQFPYSQSFKNSSAPGVLFGGDPVAFLTGGAGTRDGYNDANGSGYLRLTNNQGSQKGIVYSDVYSFPSAYGMTITFEYYTHGGNGADGIAFILFDATASPVATGAFGGSLGYAQRNSETGFSKGYLGIGIDEYGNFSANNEGKNGGVGVLSSNVTLRGAGTGTTGYPYLTSVQTTALASPFSVAGNDRTATDNTKAGFRKMEVVLRPRSLGGFFIDVYLTHGSVRDLIINNYAYTTTAPSNLKFAISSSTGGSNNFHEIRNLNITVDESTLLKPVANPDEFTGCSGLPATSGDITANDNGTVNTLGTTNKSTVDLDTATAGIQSSKTVAGKGTFTYDASTGKVTFTPVDNTVVGPVSINYTFNDTYNKTSNSSTITYKTYSQIINNTITAPAQSTFCGGSDNPGNIAGSAATASPDAITYQWESSLDNVTFNPMSGVTTQSYDPPATSTTTYYRRIANSPTCKNVSNVVAIIFGGASTPTATAATVITCNSFTANWNSVANATSYGLSVSTNSGFSSHVGNFDGRNLTSSTSYNVGGLVSGVTYYFKVWAYNNCGVGATGSNVISVTVGSGSVAGTVSSAQTICSGSSPADLTLNGYTGTIQWQSSTDNSTFININGATNPTLTSAEMGTRTANTYYRAVVTSGLCLPANTASVLVVVSSVPTVGTAVQFATVCAGSTARINLTGLIANSTSTITYSIDGVSQTPVTGVVASATGTAGFDSAVLTAANNGKILKITGITTTSTTPNCSAVVDKDITLAVNANSVGGSIASAQTICSGTSPANLVLSGNTGTVVKWQKSTDAGFTSVTDIAETSTTLAGSTIGALNATTFFRAIVQNGVCSAAFSSSVMITVNPTPSAPTASAQTFCSADAKKVSDLAATGSNLKWYNALTNGTLYTGSETLVTGTYYVSQTATGCESTRTAVSVTVNPTPSAPTASAQTFCSGDAKKVSDLAATGSNLKWYNALTNGTLYTGSETLVTGTYYVSQTTTGCESTRTAVSVTVNPTPSAPTASAQTFCSADVKKVSNLTATGSNLKWYNALTNGTLYTGSETLVTGTYYVSQTTTGCESTRTAVSVTVNPTPSAPTASAQTFCSADAKKVSDLAATGSNLKWYNALTNGTLYTGSETLVTGTYYVSQTTTGCESTRTAVSVTVNPTPSAPTASAQTFCSADAKKVSDLAATGSNLKWYNALTNGTLYTGSETLVTGTYYVSQTATGCESTRTAVSVTVNPTPSAPTASAQTFCSADAKKVSDLAATGSNLKWYNALTNGTLYTGSETLVTGTYYVSQTATGCESTRTAVSVTVNPTPSAPTASAQTFCSADAKKVSDLAATGSNLKWYNALTNGTLYTGSETLVTGTYYVSQTATGCESTRTAVSVTVNPTPSAPTASAQTFCSADAKKVSDLAATGSNLKWYNALTNGTLYTGSETLVTGTYYVSQTATGCESTRTAVSVTVNPTPSAPTASAQTFCSADAKKVSDLAATGSNLKWYNALTNGTLYTGSETLVTGTYYVSQTATGCESTRTAVSVVVNNTPVTPILSSVTQPTCSVSIGSFTITNYNSSYTYVITPSGATLNTTTGVVTGQNGTYTLTASLNNCTSAASASVKINSVICANDDNTFTAQTPGTTAVTVGNVTANDTLNGQPVTSTNTIVTAITTGPLSIDANGVLTLAANTTSGTYTITYQLCETGANPANCDTAEASVTVKGTLDAKDDNTFAVQTPNAGTPTTIGNVTTNDTLNGQPVTSANTTVTAITTGPLSIDANGILTLAPNTVSGTYTITYQLCETGANPANCDTAEASVTVKGTLDAKDDNTFTAQTPGTTAVTVGNVTTNDTLNGQPVTSANTTVTAITTGPLSIDANGVLTLAPNTVSGTYTITYQLCETGANPANCDTAEVSVTVKGTLDAKDDNTFAVQTPNAGTPTTVGNVTANDTLNGQPVTSTNTTVTAITTGPLSIDANGVLTLAPNTTSGTYTITYQLCETGANPSNCDTAEASVTVKGTLDAKDDNTFAAQVPNAGTPTTVGNVTANDTLNGQPVTSVNTTVTAITTGPLSIDANGVLTLAPNTVSGTYTIMYQLCETGANPSNCDTAEASVTVKGTLDAKDDNTFAAQTPGTTAVTVGNVTANDTLNGQPVTSANTTVTAITTGPLSIDANGVLTLAPNTVSGTYTITYQLCETGANPANCDTAEVSVTVKGTLDAKDDNTFTAQTPGTTAVTVGNVTANDTLNGQPVTSANTTVTAITTGPLSIDANGVLTLAPNTTSGTYTITYQLCETGANPANCGTAEASVTVKGTLDAKDDNTFTAQTPGTTAVTVGNVTTNDTLNGQPVTSANTTVTAITTGPLSIDANGVLTLAPNTTSGTYTITYQLCETGANPANCDTAEASVTVKGTLDAKDDNTFTAQTPGTTAVTVGNVTANDTLNGQPVTSTNTTVTAITTGPLSIDANGVLTLAPNTVSGTYTITYQLCETGANPANCDTAEVSVTVKGTLDAKDDNTFAAQTPGTTAVTVGNVTTNDTLNGQPVTSTNTTVTAITTGPLSIDANGVLTLAPNTTSGTYTITYQLCETGANPANCDTAEVSVTVKGTLDAKDDNTFAVQTPNAGTPTTVGNVTTNDILNGQPVTSANTIVTAITTGPLSIDANGVLTLAPNTISGTYTITYQLCETGANPANCDTAEVSVTVKGTLDAKDDNTFAAQTPGTTAVTVGNVTTNDTLNGQPVTSANTTVTAITTGPLSIDANGVLTLAPNTTSGTYTITYQLCETGANPANCDTAEANVTVKGTLDAKDDNTFTAQTPGTTAVTVGNVTANDTLNGQPVTSTNTTVTAITTGPLSIDANGVLTLAPNTTSGKYTITYQLCETGANPANCDTAEASVTVKGTLDAKDDNTFTAQTPGTTAVTVGNVTANDTLNGQPVTSANTTVTAITTGPLSIDANGVLTLAPNTVSGTYTITYQLCETGANPSNCDTAEASVTVKGTLDAKDDNTFTAQTPGTTVVTVGNVTTNDTLNGQPVTSTNTTVTAITTGPLSIDANGVLTLAPNTTSGTYTITYQLCETGANPANCDTAEASVTVKGTLDAKDDNTFAAQTPGTTVVTVGNVTANDTLNGQPVTSANTTVTAITTGPLSIDANGVLTLAANTTSGTYTITYQLCEIGANPANCDTAEASVTVKGTLDAKDDNTFAVQTPNAGTPTTVGNVTTNDTLNGQPVTSANTTVTAITTGPLSIDANGVLTLAPNTVSGTYTITYQLCETGANPANCDTAEASVTVKGTLDAKDDNTFTAQTPGTTAVTVGNVTTNDTLNGQPVTSANTTITAITTGPLSIDANGVLTLAPNTVSGTYTITYQLCETGANPSNCDTAEATVVVKNEIKAITEQTPPINGNLGGTTSISLTANDTLNGNPVIVGSGPGEVSFNIVGALPTGLTLNPNGTITVSPGTPKGDYTIQYTICEIGSNPSNCDTVTSVIVVTAGELVANPDVVPSVVGTNQSQTLINVFTNDTKNGAALVPSEVKFTVTTPDPKGYLTVDANGNVILAPNAPAGHYELTYEICELLNINNCSTNKVEVTVVAPTMTITADSYCSNNVPYVSYSVVADNFTPTGLLTIKWIDSDNNVVATQINQPLSGTILWPGAIVDSNNNGIDWPGWIFNNDQWTEGADGFEKTRRGVTMQFSLNPTQDVFVGYPVATADCNAQPTFIIKANNDSAGPIDTSKGVSTSLNIFDNDKLNGSPINPANVVLTIPFANANLIVNTDGSVDVKPGTPSGDYQLTYQICDISNQSQCSQATVTIKVLNSVTPITPNSPIEANDDPEVAVDGINGSLEFINVLSNDLLNGAPINPNDVTIKNTTTTNSYFEFNADGTVNVKPNTPGGNYTVTYQICEKASASNCSDATLNVFVEYPAIAIIKTAVFNDENKSGFANAGETITYNFKITNTGNVPLKDITVKDPLPGVVLSGQAISLAVNESDETTFSAEYKIKQADINLGSVSNQAIAQGASVRGVVVDDKSDDVSNAGNNPTVQNLKGCEIKVFNAFSPNNDQKNKRFYIQGLECYPNNTVEIYNRWGVLVFDIDNYNNEDRVFKGFSEGRTTVKQSDGLPVGTYFYVLKYKDNDQNSHELSGYLYLNK